MFCFSLPLNTMYMYMWFFFHFHAVHLLHPFVQHICSFVFLHCLSYPWLVTERGGALVFSFQYDNNLENEREARSTDGFEISLKDKRYGTGVWREAEVCEDWRIHPSLCRWLLHCTIPQVWNLDLSASRSFLVQVQGFKNSF